MTFMVFKSPGPEKIHGHDVEYKVIDEAEKEVHLAEGWFATAIEAGESRLKALAAAAEREVQAVEDKAAATREEAIQKLEELGVTFDRRLGLSKLLKLIEDEIGARAMKLAPAADPAVPEDAEG